MHKTPNDYGTLRRHVWALPFTIVMLCGGLVSWWAGNNGHMAIATFLVISSALPLVIERIWRVRLPAFLQVMYVAFLFSSMFAGEVLGMYGRFHPWDDIMHFVSGLFIGLASVLWLASVVDRTKQPLSPWLHALCVFCLGAAMAVVWEVIEFGSDHLFGTFTQRNDLFDTMTDLIYGSGSALIVALLLYRALHQRYSLGLNRIIAHYLALNR